MTDKYEEQASALCDSLNLLPEHSPRRGETHQGICAQFLRSAAAEARREALEEAADAIKAIEDDTSIDRSVALGHAEQAVRSLASVPPKPSVVGELRERIAKEILANECAIERNGDLDMPVARGFLEALRTMDGWLNELSEEKRDG